jgi:MoaA/NifB/PqqE/SkfB family radical SAM enzyme
MSARIGIPFLGWSERIGIPFLGRFYRLAGRYRHFGGNAWICDRVPGGDDGENHFRSKLRLFENGVPLLDAHHSHQTVATYGGGRYSHWGNELIFSATDNSNPNTNGRKYTYDFGLQVDTWAPGSRLWQFHPRADYFLARGGTEVAPPFQCNIGLTNKCNLRCEICGSQKFLDETGVRRRHMDRATFEAVAETLFPVLVSVELNSQGDPLLHPDITVVLQKIKDHRCNLKVQTNGTLFSDKIITLLVEHHGTVMLSLDAVGPKFDEVRRGGVWIKAEAGLNQFLAARDAQKMVVGVYPTLTKRTIGEALNVVRWAVENRVDLVTFHRYVPIQGSLEESPTDREYAALVEQLAKWAADNCDPLEIWYESKQLNSKTVPSRRTQLASPEKHACVVDRDRLTFPLEAHNGDPLYICTAPSTYLEIGLEGQIAACCRAQDVPLGYATSVEAFADAWLGKNYDRIRTSLKRGQTGRYPLPNCESCIKFFAPIAGGNRTAVDYDSEIHPADGLKLADSDVIMLEAIQKEGGRCFIARLIPGVDPLAYSLYEDERCLSAHPSLHDDIRNLGAGRFAINGRSLYFSTSDGTDARRNGRQYSLRRVQAQPGEIRLRSIIQDSGHCLIADLPAGLDPLAYSLYENEYCLSAHPSLHDDIRKLGAGRYAIDGRSLYFSTSDDTDPRCNGRRYSLRRVQAQPGEICLQTVTQDSGHCFIAGIREGLDPKELILLEDDRVLGPADCLHDDIRAQGLGRYSVWNQALYFSASDNSDPRANGRCYRLKRIYLGIAAE